jgi:predicted patatin/cPLA2 family phospholipase
MYALILKPRAILMTKEAYNWYELQRPGLGEEFLAELDGICHAIQTQPKRFSKIKQNFRQA